jgi:hypothetical protein
MDRRSVVIKAVIALALVWVVVWGVRAWAGSRKITAEKVTREIQAGRFEDWSGGEGSPAEAERRQNEILRISELIVNLDFKEREKNRQNRQGEEFFRKLSPGEKELFLNRTVLETMNRFMEALDDLEPAERRRFIQQAMREIDEGRTKEEMDRAQKLDPNLVDRISQDGMKAYFSKADADTKLDLAPLMEAMNEVMQGFRGNPFENIRR